MVNKETYLAVLKEEKIKLLTEFYKPDEEGTGHFNTAASVLQFRIEQLENLIEIIPVWFDIKI